MTNKIELKKTSKFLSLILRHQPDVIGVELDPQGWLEIDLLIDKAKQNSGRKFSRELIEQVVRDNDKQRFSISEDGKRIRANQGHSLASVELELTPKIPPEYLYHGTVEKFIEAIRIEGLKKMARNHVHLSADLETAQKVGSRRGKPIILRILARQMHEEGIPFFLSENGVWLTDQVPATSIQFDW